MGVRFTPEQEEPHESWHQPPSVGQARPSRAQSRVRGCSLEPGHVPTQPRPWDVRGHASLKAACHPAEISQPPGSWLSTSSPSTSPAWHPAGPWLVLQGGRWPRGQPDGLSAPGGPPRRPRRGREGAPAPVRRLPQQLLLALLPALLQLAHEVLLLHHLPGDHLLVQRLWQVPLWGGQAASGQGPGLEAPWWAGPPGRRRGGRGPPPAAPCPHPGPGPLHARSWQEPHPGAPASAGPPSAGAP